jgi:hypothetical protein
MSSTFNDDLLSFPVLTRETGDSGAASPVRSGAPAGMGGRARDALRQVLGWRYSTADVRGFTAALRQTATPRTITGQVTWEWRSPTYMVRADLGEVTGAQASLLNRVRQNAAEATRLTRELGSLKADADIEDVEAVRSLILTHLEELVAEVGQLGGPRTARVDSLLWSLLGGLTTTATTGGTAFFDSLLGQLQVRLGLAEEQVNTLDDEHIWTHFIELRDVLLAINSSWLSFRSQWQDGRASLGALLVQLGRYLDVIVESVAEAEACMDSVFFGPAERQAYQMELTPRWFDGIAAIWPAAADGTKMTVTIAATGKNGKPTQRLVPVPASVTMTVADLLGWIRDFASDEARRLVQDGGKDGLVNACFVLARLFLLTDAMANRTRSEVDVDPAAGTGCSGCHGINHPRVLRALCELACYLNKAALLDPGRTLRVPIDGAYPYNLLYVDTPDQAVDVVARPDKVAALLRAGETASTAVAKEAAKFSDQLISKPISAVISLPIATRLEASLVKAVEVKVPAPTPATTTKKTSRTVVTDTAVSDDKPST